MIKRLFFLLFLFVSTQVFSKDARIIEIDGFERTSSSIIVWGRVGHIPPGTKMWITVKSIDGKPINENRDTIKTMHDVYVSQDNKFQATIKRFGSLDRYDFPDGKYGLEFFAGFSLSWQSVEVAKAVGVVINEDGQYSLGEPAALPRSPDLKLREFGGSKVRFLQASRTIDIKKRKDDVPKYLTKSIKIEIHDLNAKKNPVRTMPATRLLHREVIGKIGRIQPSESVVLVCMGPYKNGSDYLAKDIYYSGGRPNKDFVVTYAATLLELCYQQEDDYNKKQGAQI